MTAFVLVHGAFRGGWAWTFVRERLEAAGHTVYSPDLKGAGARYAGEEVVTLDDWVDDLAHPMEWGELHDVVMVGHSQGGVVITAASNSVPDRIARLVYLDAPAPAHGERTVDLTPAEVAAAFGPPPPPEAWLPARPLDPSGFLDDERTAWANERLTPSPARPAYDVVRLDDPRALALPRTHVFFAQTPEGYPATWARRRLDEHGVAYDVLDAGHDAPLTHPDLVATHLLQLAG